MSKCPPGICRSPTQAAIDLKLATTAVENALKSALAEIRRQGGPDYLILEALNEGLAAAKPFLDAIHKD